MKLLIDSIRKVDPMGSIHSRFMEQVAKLEKARNEKITLQTIALETKLAYGTVLKWAKNQVTRYDSETLATLCEYFDAEPGDLLGYKR